MAKKWWIAALVAVGSMIIDGAEAAKIPIAGVSQADTDNPLRSLDSVTISPDGTTLAIIGNLTSGNNNDFGYTVPIAGGTPTQVSNSIDVDGAMRWTGDGNTIVYLADVGANNALFRVPATGGTSTQVDPTPARFNFRLTPNGQTAVFITKPSDPGPDLLRTVPVAGGQVTVISTPLPGGEGDTDSETFNFSRDGSTIIFATDARFDSPNESSLFFSPITGGGATEIPLNGVRPEDNFDIDTVEMTRDGLVAFVGDYAANGLQRVNTIPFAGGTPTEVVIDNLLSTGDVSDFAISPDGTTLAIIADLETVNVFELFVVPITGGTAIKVSDPITAEAIDLDVTGDGIPDISDGEVDGDVSRDFHGAIAWTPDGSQLVYVADAEIDEVREAYVVDNALATDPDINGDGAVDGRDFLLIQQNLGLDEQIDNSMGDAFPDGTVNQLDIWAWEGKFGQVANQVAAASATVPEPSALVILSLAIFTLGARRRA